jgi:predicted transcriptional regulator
MGCINADGTLTQTARKVLTAIQHTSSESEIAKQMSFPVYLVRSSLRELGELGLVDEQNGQYTITEAGLDKL